MDEMRDGSRGQSLIKGRSGLSSQQERSCLFNLVEFMKVLL